MSSNLSEERGELPSFRPLALVTGRLLARRWPLYLCTCLAVILLETIFTAFVHVKLADFYAGLIGSPLVIVVVTVFIGADATSTLTVAQRWERIIERAWALIVFDVGLSLIITSGLGAMLAANDALDAFFGVLTLMLCGMLVYAEPFIALEKDAQTLTLLPFAILRSMMLAWINVPRIFALLALQIAALIAELLAHQAAAHVHLWAALLVDIPLGTLLQAPLAALFTVAYLDTLSQERKIAL